MLVSLFNKAERSATFLKIDSNTGASCGYCEILKNSFLIEQLRWLLLTVLSRYSKVIWGICSLISRLHMLSILIKNLRETLHKLFFTIMWQNNFFVAWIDWSSVLDFRICFEKTLVVFDFDEKSYTKLCPCNYVTSRVKRHSSPFFCSWSGAFNLRV